MEKEELRKSILERIQKIDDINRLNAIQTILNTLDSEQISLEEVNEALETEDFSGYIKEWLKNMQFYDLHFNNTINIYFWNLKNSTKPTKKLVNE